MGVKVPKWAELTSPNPGGRPRSRLLAEALRNRLAEIKADHPEKRSWAEIIASNLVELAVSKSPSAVAAANEIGDRAEGRPAQHIKVSNFEADLQARSDEELEFYLAHSRWPTDEERALLSAPSDTPPS